MKLVFVKYLPAPQTAAIAIREIFFKEMAMHQVNLYVAPEQLDSFVTSETKKWRDTALSIGIKAE